uniref:G-protein coupled receptors family 1 profile domain-containing protein n=1 Tax=Sus scrofa TaxID=9823 RepID=A0A8D0V440_PIG
IMADSNSTAFTNPSTFLLMGIPGLEDFHVWISIPLCSMYVVALMGNTLILFVVKTETVLHEPLFYFLSLLAVTDLILSTSTLPKMLGVFWFNSHEISFHACLTQMFFIHAFSGVESGLLVAMALDRYVASCRPLRHSSILTSSAVAQVGIAALARGLVLVFPHPFLVRMWPYCRSRVVPHSYCEHMAVVKLACADISISSLYSLTVIVLIVGTDVTFIALSYVQILHTVFTLPSKDARLKTLSTCGSHACVILTFYVPALFSFLTHRVSKHIPHHTHVLLAIMYLLIPPMLNPIIYGVRTKHIRACVLRLFLNKIS